MNDVTYIGIAAALLTTFGFVPQVLGLVYGSYTEYILKIILSLYPMQ